jgi:cephalosporin hydroxylase
VEFPGKKKVFVMRSVLCFLRWSLGNRLFKSDIVNRFNCLYSSSRHSWRKNKFLGYPILQCPFDLQIYQELIFEQRPPFILETGVAAGGSLLYFASILDLIGADPSSLVIGVDIVLSDKAKTLNHPRIRLVEGSSIDPGTIDRIKALLPAPAGMVILDSDHSRNHVLTELRLYRQFVAVGSYLVTEDTIVNGRPVRPFYGPGPGEAVHEFLKEDDRFVRDDALWKRNLFSFHQYGWLKRVR